MSYEDGPPTRLCNYCLYQKYKLQASKDGLKVSVRRNPKWSGVDLFIHPKDVVIEKGAEDKRHPQKKYWKIWFAELPGRCAC